MTSQRSPDDEDARASLQIAEGYFEDWQRKLDFLQQLFDEGHNDEALLLCCCYIDALASLLWPEPEKGSAWRFVRVLKEYGGEEALWHIHPKQLRTWLDNARARRTKAVGKALSAVLEKARGRLYTEEEILGLAQGPLTAHDVELLKKDLWRGTLAAVAYDWLRSPLVHELSAPNSITFDSTRLGDEGVPALNFELLYPALRRVLPQVKLQVIEAIERFLASRRSS